MANNSTISVAYKIEDVGGSLKKLSLDAEGLKNIFETIVNETEKLKDQAIDLIAIATNMDCWQHSNFFTRYIEGIN